MEKEQIELPHEIAKEIRVRSAKANEVNIKHATTLHEHGGDFALYVMLEHAVRVWFHHHVAEGSGPMETIEALMDTVKDNILDYGIDDVLKSGALTPEAAALEGVKGLMESQGLETVGVASGSLDEIIEQLEGMRDAEGETKQ